MLDVFFYEAFEEEAAELKRLMPKDIAAGYDAKAIGETESGAPPARMISIRTQSVLPVAWCDRLDGILTRSTGYDHVADYRNRCGRALPAGHLPLYCARAVAEQALLLWMGLWRKLALQQSHFERFCRDGLSGRECAGKTLLVVGVGHIGHEVVRIGTGLGMTALGVDLLPRHADVSYVGIEEGLARADAIVCAMSLTPQSRGYFNRDRWRWVKPGAVFVNVGRGESAPISDLLPALESGRLAGVALDVYEHEPAVAAALRAGRRPNVPAAEALEALRRRPDTLCTPHNAFNTEEAVVRKSVQSVEQIVKFLQTGRFKWPI